MLLVLVCVFYTYVTLSIMLRWARMLRELALVSAAGGLAMGILGLLARLFPAGRPWWGAAGVVTVLAVVGTLVARTELRSSQIHERFGVNRPPFN